ncbi:hypothetical protein [Tardiphaga sp. P9-11]|uniref:hypothetical protein n=1 Tax=Tardiphaga sp. P9-11 TaxID=2024614 RepID=UPI0011F0E820|nr:hypothetical protein [Tardiphaga sp. P9-11]KAA0076096.1 hypothetical protein CIW50_07495 [Tardiphaga sp. P9-11]
MTLTLGLGILFFWTIWFALIFVPAYWVGRWLAPKNPAELHPVVYVALAAIFGLFSQLAVLIAVIAIMFGELFVFGPSPSLKVFMKDPQGFGGAFVNMLLFVPTFAALVAGYWKARRRLYGARGGLTPN